MVPSQSDPRWSRVLTNKSDIANAGLATRILISRLRQDVAADPGSISAKVDELRTFFTKNEFAQRDIALL